MTGPLTLGKLSEPEADTWGVIGVSFVVCSNLARPGAIVCINSACRGRQSVVTWLPPGATIADSRLLISGDWFAHRVTNLVRSRATEPGISVFAREGRCTGLPASVGTTTIARLSTAFCRVRRNFIHHSYTLAPHTYHSQGGGLVSQFWTEGSKWRHP